MPELLPTPIGCSTSCTPSATGGPPGVQGPPGEPGTNGTNGTNAYTFVASQSPDPQPVMPAEGGTVAVETTTSTAFLQPNQFVYVGFWGWMKVYSVVDDTNLLLLNPENTASGSYAENAPPGTSLPALTRITLAGIQGPAGDSPADALLAANNLSDVDSPSSSRSNLGLGTAAVLNTGVTNGLIPIIDTTFTSGDAVFATGTGLQTKGASAARTALGLGTMATQADSAVAITGGTINGTQIGNSTPAIAAFTTLSANGPTTLSTLFTPSTTIQSLLAATTVSPNATKIRVVGNGGAVALTATPTITTPSSDGQLLLIMGTSDTNTVTFQDESNAAGTKLRLNGGNDRVLGLYDTLLLCWDGTTGFWVEVAFSDN